MVTFIVLLGFETFLFSLSNQPDVSGRFIDIIAGRSHRPTTSYRAGGGYELIHFFQRWKLIPKYNVLLTVGFLIGGFGLVSKDIRCKMPNSIWLCFYAGAIYLLIMTFPIIGFKRPPDWMQTTSPVIPILALDLHSRYLTPFFSLAAIFVVWVWIKYIKKVSELLQKTVLIISLVMLSLIFFVGTTLWSCNEEIDGKTFKLLSDRGVEQLFCKGFRYSQEQNIYPAPNMFILRANRYYEKFNRDYLEGKVALYGGTRIGVFQEFIGVRYPNLEYLKNGAGWYSIDGAQKENCVKELGQVYEPSYNYHNCKNIQTK